MVLWIVVWAAMHASCRTRHQNKRAGDMHTGRGTKRTLRHYSGMERGNQIKSNQSHGAASRGSAQGVHVSLQSVGWFPLVGAARPWIATHS